MKSFRKAGLIIAETTAFCWFFLHRIPYPYLIPLPLIGVVWRKMPPLPFSVRRPLNGAFLLFSLLLSARTVGFAIYNGGGIPTLVFLFLAAGLFSARVPPEEWRKIAGAWSLLFWAFFLLLALGAVFGIKSGSAFPLRVNALEVIVFYALALLEPLCFPDANAAPLLLGGALLPFSVIAYYALGNGAFLTAEFPYLSVWTGVSIAAFHHVEGLMVGVLCGVCGLRAGAFFKAIKKSGSVI